MKRITLPEATETVLKHVRAAGGAVEHGALLVALETDGGNAVVALLPHVVASGAVKAAVKATGTDSPATLRYSVP